MTRGPLLNLLVGERGTAVFLAILAPATAPGPALIDVHTEEPWRSLRAPLVFPA